MATDLSQLGILLMRELEADASDSLVDGGLDELLRFQARDEQAGSALLRMIAALPPTGYRSLGRNARQTWLRRALATIRRESSIGNNVETSTKPSSKNAPKTGPQYRSRSQAQRRRSNAKNSNATKRTSAKTHQQTSTTRAVDLPKGQTPRGTAQLGLELPISKAGTRLGKANLTRLEKLGINTIADALRHFPNRHQDFSQTVPITHLQINEEQTIKGIVDRAREIRMGRGGRMRSTEATISDESGASIRVTWFNQPFIAKSLPAGTEIAIAGRVTIFRGHATFQNPEFERIDPNSNSAHTGRLIPVYPLTSGLAQRTIRGMIAKLLEHYGEHLEDPLPKTIRERHHLLRYSEAIQQLHYPSSKKELDAARRRLAFDELLTIQIAVQKRKTDWKATGDAPAISDHTLADGFLNTLPFKLTDAQRRVIQDVRNDLSRTLPMSRLLEGDVGSGKTIVALAAMIDLVSAGYQSVMMAPTEVLAEQHFRTICTLLSGEPEPPLNGMIQIGGTTFRTVLLTGSTKAKPRRDALDAIKHGGAQIIVGTHSLIQENVQYHRLGLAIVDEQHRFGVLQRGELRRRGQTAREQSHTPHLMVMSATPIPRSLALTVFGDLDLSIIDEMPPGRTPIETKWLKPIERSEAFKHIRREIENGRQAFVICPLVDDSAAVESRAATEEYERLRTEQFPELSDRIALLHGRMSSKNKDMTMRAFASGEFALLVSTAVVEVGIDVANATVIVIEGADRFGLAQLHQFRGRVGRGEHPSFCYLLSDDPSADAQKRLAIMEQTKDGFTLAQADLELRGPGDLYGIAQSGIPTLRVASLLDAPLIDTTRREAEKLLETDPDLKEMDHRAIRYVIAKNTSQLIDEQH